jgi:hypothetical protein
MGGGRADGAQGQFVAEGEANKEAGDAEGAAPAFIAGGVGPANMEPGPGEPGPGGRG